ncbi:hypothetical protein C8R44DRAFT_724641 [Mycena epipterygia]|nr:hypothetical protein C8R44DRAFT_724641 [Mycena epipterygia]
MARSRDECEKHDILTINKVCNTVIPVFRRRESNPGFPAGTEAKVESSGEWQQYEPPKEEGKKCPRRTQGLFGRRESNPRFPLHHLFLHMEAGDPMSSEARKHLARSFGRRESNTGFSLAQRLSLKWCSGLGVRSFGGDSIADRSSRKGKPEGAKLRLRKGWNKIPASKNAMGTRDTYVAGEMRNRDAMQSELRASRIRYELGAWPVESASDILGVRTSDASCQKSRIDKGSRHRQTPPSSTVCGGNGDSVAAVTHVEYMTDERQGQVRKVTAPNWKGAINRKPLKKAREREFYSTQIQRHFPPYLPTVKPGLGTALKLKAKEVVGADQFGRRESNPGFLQILVIRQHLKKSGRAPCTTSEFPY